MRSSLLYYGGFEERQLCNESHFLEFCFLCHKRLAPNCDIFMYRGNTPFCSQECRQQQIEKDESKETKWKHSSSSTKRSGSNKAVQTGFVAVV